MLMNKCKVRSSNLLLLSANFVSNPLSAKTTDVNNYAVLIYLVDPVSRSTLRG